MTLIDLSWNKHKHEKQAKHFKVVERVTTSLLSKASYVNSLTNSSWIVT